MSSIEDKLAMSLDDLLKGRPITNAVAARGAVARGVKREIPSGGNYTACVGKRCYVGNLSFKTSWQDLKDHFRQAGNVVYAKVLGDEATKSSKGCGIVEFETPEEAARAITLLHDKELGGRLLIVREDREDRDLKLGYGNDTSTVLMGSPGTKRSRTDGSLGAGAVGGLSGSRRCYVGNLSYRTSWQDLKDHFRQIGKVVYTNVMEESPGRSKGCGIVEFETAAEAQKAIAVLHDSELSGRQIFVREDREDLEVKQVVGPGVPRGGGAPHGGGGPQGRGAMQGARAPHGAGALAHGGVAAAAAFAALPGESRRVFVGNLSYRTSWQDLKDHFRQVGPVVYSNILEEAGTKRSKGCGIVEFQAIGDATKAIQLLHDSELNGRQIFVREDREDRDFKAS